MENQKVSLITPVGDSNFTIPEDMPKTLYLDVYGRSYKIYSDGTIEEETKCELCEDVTLTTTEVLN